jgi:hypothetical protein
MPRRFHAPSLALLLAAAPLGLAAQQSPRPATPADTFGIIVGTVRASGTDQPIPFARVSAGDRQREVLASADGTFRLQGVAGGARALSVRQIGYEPGGTAVVVDGTRGAPPSSMLVVALARLPIMLDTIVIASGACTAKGFANAADAPIVQRILQQVAINAEQYIGLLAKYPVSVTFARRRWVVSASGTTNGVLTDTLTQIQSTTLYEPGSVLDLKTDGEGKTTFHITLPAFGSLASPVFQDHHCFRYAGTDSVLGHRLYRIDFVPTADVKTADVAGSIYLDRDTYVLRHARFQLVNVPAAEGDFRDLEATTSYREISPFFIVNGGLDATRKLLNAKLSTGERLVEGLQADRFISYKFLDAKPSPVP